MVLFLVDIVNSKNVFIRNENSIATGAYDILLLAKLYFEPLREHRSKSWILSNFFGIGSSAEARAPK